MKNLLFDSTLMVLACVFISWAVGFPIARGIAIGCALVLFRLSLPRWGVSV